MRMLSFEILPDRQRVIVAPRDELDIATVEYVAAEMGALVGSGCTDLVAQEIARRRHHYGAGC
jgi:hypothetical protein